jgi:hypothetical protein
LFWSAPDASPYSLLGTWLRVIIVEPLGQLVIPDADAAGAELANVAASATRTTAPAARIRPKIALRADLKVILLLLRGG